MGTAIAHRCGHQFQDYDGQPLPCATCHPGGRTIVVRKAPAPTEWTGSAPDGVITEVIFTRAELALDENGDRFSAWLWDCDEWRADRERQAAAKIKALPAANWS